MLNLTKPQKETIYMKVVRVLLSATFLVVPLIFFTDLTQNPFFAQNVLLYVLIALIYATLAVKFLRTKSIDFTKTFFDLAFFVYMLACAMGWLSALSSEPQALRQTLVFNMLNYGTLLLFVAVGAYIISKNVVFSGTIESKTNYILLFFVWGGLWYLAPLLKTTSSSETFLAQLWDWYGVLLWGIGVFLGVRVLKKLTQENIFVLIFVAVFLACGYGVLQALGLDFLWPFAIDQFATKAFSTFGNPNFLSSAVVMLLPALLVYFMRTDSKKDFIVYGLLVLMYVLYLSFGLARSCWIGAVCALVMMWMFGTLRSLIWQRKGRVFLLALLAVGVAYSSVYMPGPGNAISPVKNRVLEMRPLELEDFALDVKKERIFQSLHQRLLMWDTSKEIFLTRPVLGSGVGNYQMAFAQNQPKTLLKYPELRALKTTTNAPHNEILFQLAQGGLVGVGLFVFMFMVLFLEVKDFAAHKKEGDKKQLLQAIFCGILGMLVDNMLNISLHAVVPAFIFWWFVGAEVSGVGKEERKIILTANPATKALAITVLAGCACVLLWQGVWFASEYEAFVGEKKIAAHNDEGAVKNLSAALWLYPANTEAGFRLGQVLLRQQKYTDSLRVLEKTMSAAAYYEEVYYQAALAALGTNDPKKAVHYLMDHLRLSPYHLQAYELLATLLQDNVLYAEDDEMAMLERGLKLFPYQTNLWLQVGELYQKKEETQKAKDVYQRGLSVDTLSATLLKAVRSFYSAKDEPSLVAQAQTLQNYQAKAEKFTKMSAYYQHKLRENLESYVQQYPQDLNGRILLARLFSLSGNDLKAEELLHQVLRKRPDNLWANLALSTLYYQAEDMAGAKRALENALFYYPDQITASKRLKALEK